MKKLRKNIDGFYDRMDNRWRAMPVGKQRRYTLYFFAGYFLLTVGVLLKVWVDTCSSAHQSGMKSIERPSHLQDTLLTILKDKK